MNAPETHIASDCRRRLLEAAAAIFREEGYRAGVDRIAARAGVAKQTLYNHFPTKADLFREVVKHGTANMLVSLEDDGRPLVERLLGFCRSFRAKVLAPEGIAFYRAITAEAPRFPELAAAFYADGPAQATRRLADVLAAAMESGDLRRDDPAFAAEMLLSMLVGADRNRCLLDAEPRPQTDNAERILDVFLRAYAS